MPLCMKVSGNPVFRSRKQEPGGIYSAVVTVKLLTITSMKEGNYFLCPLTMNYHEEKATLSYQSFH